MFDIVSFIEENNGFFYNKDNMTMDCLNPSCRKGKGHFQISINPNKRSCHCFKCGYRSNWAGLVARLKNIPYEEAKEITEDVFFVKQKIEKKFDPVSLPIRSQWNNAAWDYLIGRGLTRDDIFEREIYYTSEFSKYRDRIILPVKISGEVKAFQARSIIRNPRYLSSEGIGRFVYGLDEIQGSEKVFIVEGIFDQISVARFKYPVVASFSKKITTDQIILLKNAGIKYVDLMFDGDAVNETIKYFYELEKYFEVGIIPMGDQDPGECEDIDEVISQRIDNIEDFQKIRMENFKRKFDKG